MSAVLPTPSNLQPRRGLLLGAAGWTAVIAIVLVITVGVPVLNLVVPDGSVFHISDYTVSLAGKILCYAICALAMDLIWGYTGILSLGHGLFFSLGGYAMGMYLMRQIGRDGQYKSDMPDFMVFLNWKSFPWHWTFSDSFVFQLAMVVLVPGLLAFVFGWFAFRSRIKGVYFSIITQAMTFAAMLLFFRNETGFGGNNGFTDFKRILGLPDSHRAHAGHAVRDHRLHAGGLLRDGTRHRQQQVRPRAAGDPRRRDARDVHRLQPGGLQAEHLDALGRDVRDRRCAVRAAGRHHQPERDVARRPRSRSPSGRRWAAAPR